MAENKHQLLKVSLVLSAVITLGYGVIYLVFPEFQIRLAGGEPIEPGWIRWAGGVLIAMGIGSVMVFRNPAKQGIFITSFAIASLLVALANFYELVFRWNASYNLMNTLIPAIVLIVVSIMLWISLRQSKEILW